MRNIGAVMAGQSSAKRQRDDYYPTPAPTTRAILPVLREFGFPKQLWEPCCGEGHMAHELTEGGYDVVSTDLVNRGFGEQLDFLKSTEALASAIVTNPPFKHLDEFIVHALVLLNIEHMALILPNNFWNGSKRARALFNAYPPSIHLPLTWRIDSTGAGNPTMSLAWTVWSSTAASCCQFRPLVTDEKNPGRFFDPLS